MHQDRAAEDSTDLRSLSHALANVSASRRLTGRGRALRTRCALRIATRHRFPVIIAGTLAVIGLPVALFHRYEQAAGEVGGLCEAANPCSAQWVSHFGFITIPTMAAAGFVGVAVFTTLHLRRSS